MVMLDPDEIAKTYLYVPQQHRSAWTWEIETIAYPILLVNSA